MKHALLLVFALLGACAGPRPEPPASARITVPETWRYDTATDPALSPTWWMAFGDAALSKLVDQALQANNDVQIAAERVAQAKASFELAQSQQRPTANGEVAGMRERGVSPLGEPQLQTAGQAQLAIGYDLDLFGRLRFATDAARAAFLASDAGRDAVRLTVESSTVRAYLSLRALDARLEVLRRTLASRAESLKYAQRRWDAGYSTRLDLSQAQSDYKATEQLIPATELAIESQENGLRLLLGALPGEIPRGRAFEELSVPSVPPVIPSSILRRRPDIAAAEWQVVSSDRSLDSARAAFMPSVQLGASGGLVASTLLADPIRIFSLGGSILVPLFEGGRLRAQADLAAARRDEAAFTYQKTVLTAFREVEEALATARRTSSQEALVREQRQSLDQTLKLATNRYRGGYSPYLEQLDAQRALLNADLSLVQVRENRLNAAVALLQAMGGGWEAQAR